MGPECRLQVVAWLYIGVGTWAAIEFVAGLFTPLSEPLFQLIVANVNLAMLILPLGIGLRKKIEICRKLGLVVSLGCAAVAAAVGVFVAGGALLRDREDFSFAWGVNEGVTTGDMVSKAVVGIVICLPLFIWQLRVLWSEDTKIVTGGAGVRESIDASPQPGIGSRQLLSESVTVMMSLSRLSVEMAAHDTTFAIDHRPQGVDDGEYGYLDLTDLPESAALARRLAAKSLDTTPATCITSGSPRSNSEPTLPSRA